MKTNKSGVVLVKPLNNSLLKVLCRCPLCGNDFEMWKSHFYRGSNSCKCRYLGKEHPRLYRIWTNIKTRCFNKNAPVYNNYGGRGINLCDEWMEFAPFMKWSLSHGYSDDLAIDRIDNNGDYEPNNCRWVNANVQANNKRNNIYVDIDYKGQTLKRFCFEHGLNYKSEHTYKYRHGLANEIKRLLSFTKNGQTLNNILTILLVNS